MGRGLPTLGEEPKAERKGRSAAEVCTSEARKIGETPCAARSGQSPLARLVFRICALQRTDHSGSRCGRNRPQRWERRTLCGRSVGGGLLPASVSPTVSELP